MRPSRLLCLLALFAFPTLPAPAFASHGVPLVNMSQQQVPSGTTLASGGTVTGAQIGFQVSSDSATCGSSWAHQVQFEVVASTSSFSGSPTFSSPQYAGFKPSCVVKPYPRQDVTVQTSSPGWKWRVREVTYINGSVDSTGSWTDFGTASDTDFVTNLTPTAEANGPYSGNQGTAIALSGTGSTDSGGSIALYAWDCTDNGSYDTSSSSATGSTCTYPDDGAFTVRLRVTDNQGATGTDTAAVTVTNTLPTAVATGSPYAGTRGSVVALSGAGSSDPDGVISQYAWDCGDDGTYEITSASATGSTCTFAAVGTYTVRLRVTDDDGGQGFTTGSVVIAITPPLAEAGGPYSGTKGFAISVSGAASSDPDGNLVAYAWDCGNDGTFEITGAASTAACTFSTVGTRSIVLRVTDDDGATNTDTASVVVGNDAPTANAGGPYVGNEGSAIALDGSGSADLGSGVIAQYAWDCTDNGSYDQTSASPTASACSYPDNGTFTVRLRVTDDDGATATATSTVTTNNVAPSIVATVPTAGSEGTAVSVSAVGTDASSVDQAALSFAWTATNAGGGTVGTATGTSASFTFTDNGSYTVSVVVTDPQGATATGAGVVVIANVPPTITSTSGPGTLPEGSAGVWNVAVTDAGTGDLSGLVVTWDWGDNTSTSGLSVAHAFADDGTYSITVGVEDDDGGLTTTTLSVVATNVAPTIVSLADTFTEEGTEYTYLPAVTDPGDEVFVWSLSASAPAGMTVDPATGFVSWTPSYAQALAGAATFVLTVSDGDGGTDSESVQLSVDWADGDGDDLPDTWELNNGLDPLDPFDGGSDPDADGLTNLDEWDGGTDPNVYDGPGAPTLVAPIAGAEAGDVSPDLTLGNAVDPNGDALTYEIEVWAEAAMTAPVTSAVGIAQGSSGQTTWKVDVVLSENTLYYWRARAADAFVSGPFTGLESFTVNALDEAPTVPVLVYPVDSESADASPTLLWSESSDADGDALTYDVQVWDALDGLVTEATGILGDGLEGSWVVDVPLAEDTLYAWTARAVDMDGAAGDWAEVEWFFVDTSNAAPYGVAFLEPEDRSSLLALPTLRATEGEDPEGDTLEYRFLVDTTLGFDSAGMLDETVSASGTGVVEWDLTGQILPENATIYARVQAIDEGGVASLPDTISFFLRGENDPPSVPQLATPEDGEEGPGGPLLVVWDPTDPEGDLVTIEFVVGSVADLATPLTSAIGVFAGLGGGTTSWALDVQAEGTIYWSARAVDELGAASDWAVPFRYVAPSESGVEPEPDPEGCAQCQKSVGVGRGSWVAALALLPLLRRRRGRGE